MWAYLYVVLGQLWKFVQSLNHLFQNFLLVCGRIIMDIRNFFICNRRIDSSGNNDRSDVENEDTKEITQPLEVTEERDSKSKSSAEPLIPVPMCPYQS